MTGKRIKRLREEKNISQVELSKRTGINQTSLSLFEHEDREPNADNLRILADFFKVSVDYLMCRDLDGNIDIPERPEMVSVNVVGSVAAGIPIEAIENVIDKIEIPKKWTKDGSQYIGLLVSGDSMYPKYQVGDIVIIKIQDDCENGQDAVVYVNGYDATLKTVRKVGNAIILQPVNPKYKTRTYGTKDDKVRIFGVVKRLVRDV